MITNRCAMETSHQNTSFEYIDCIDISNKKISRQTWKKVSTKFDDLSRIQKFRNACLNLIFSKKHFLFTFPWISFDWCVGRLWFFYCWKNWSQTSLLDTLIMVVGYVKQFLRAFQIKLQLQKMEFQLQKMEFSVLIEKVTPTRFVT